MSTIVLVEDDPLQRDLLETELGEEFPQLRLISVSTESAFLDRLQELSALQPALLVIDVMLLWAYPGADAPKPPPNYQGFARAGIRCLRQWLTTRSSAKVIFHSVIPEADLRPDLQELEGRFDYVAKDDEGEGLIDAIRKALRV